MICQRCGGQMHHEKIFSKQDSYWARKCLFCGECVDEVILANRIDQTSLEADPRKIGRPPEPNPEESPEVSPLDV